MTELDRVDDLLRRTTMALVYQCMLPPNGEVTKDHLWHCVWLAQDIENLYRARGHWNRPAAGALIDMNSARLEAVRLILHPEGQRGDAEKVIRERASRADETPKSDSWRTMSEQEQSDFWAIVQSIQRREGESDEDWRKRYRRFEETGETDLPADVQARLRPDPEYEWTMEDADLRTVHGTLLAWSLNRLATKQALLLLPLIENEQDLRQAAISSGLNPPS